jgi:hypothetical protein
MSELKSELNLDLLKAAIDRRKLDGPIQKLEQEISTLRDAVRRNLLEALQNELPGTDVQRLQEEYGPLLRELEEKLVGRCSDELTRELSILKSLAA